MRALPPAFFWRLSITGEAMLRSALRSAKVRMDGERGVGLEADSEQKRGLRRDSARSRGPSCQTDQKCMSPSCRRARCRRRTSAPGTGLEGHHGAGASALSAVSMVRLRRS